MTHISTKMDFAEHGRLPRSIKLSNVFSPAIKVNQFYKRFNVDEEHVWNSPVAVIECVKASTVSVSDVGAGPLLPVT